MRRYPEIAMSRRLLRSLLVFCFLVSAAPSGLAQVIIVQPRDPVKDAEDRARSMLTDWVKTYLGRKPTDKEMATMMTRLRNGTNPALVQASILSSDEYYKKSGGTSPAFVTALFNDVLAQKVGIVDRQQLSAQLNVSNRKDFVVNFLKAAMTPNNPFAMP
jgi:hypothetical protein